MILAICTVLGGALWGASVARRRGGKRADMAQYAAGYAIALTVLGLFVSVLIGQFG
ncbi:MAG: hypothetical protein AAGK37_00040 [Pseudomonadota bacterium]